MPRKPKLKIEFVDELPAKTYDNAGGKSADPIMGEFADGLRNVPKTWAKYPKTVSRSYASSLVAQIHSADARYPIAFQGTDFEAKVRNGVLYVRFNPNGQR